MLTNTKQVTTSETLKERLKNREKVWIKKLKALQPFGLNQQPNYIPGMQC